MKAGMLRLKVKPEKLYEFEDKWKTELHERIRNEPGFMSALLFHKSESGKCYSIGFWENEESARNFGKSKTFNDFILSIREFLVSEPERETYDVSGDLSGISEVKKAA